MAEITNKQILDAVDAYLDTGLDGEVVGTNCNATRCVVARALNKARLIPDSYSASTSSSIWWYSMHNAPRGRMLLSIDTPDQVARLIRLFDKLDEPEDRNRKYVRSLWGKIKAAY